MCRGDILYKSIVYWTKLERENLHFIDIRISLQHSAGQVWGSLRAKNQLDPSTISIEHRLVTDTDRHRAIASVARA